MLLLEYLSLTMKFKQLADLYQNSAAFQRLEVSTSQKHYKSAIKKLTVMLEDYEFKCFTVASDSNSNSMQIGVAVVEDANHIFTELSLISSESVKIFTRRVFLVIWRWAEASNIAPVGISRSLPAFRAAERTTKVISHAEVQAVDSTPSPAWMEPYKEMAKFCFFSGLRPSEAESLKWDDIRKDGFIEVRNAKGRNKGSVGRLCKITDQIKSALPTPTSSPLVFVSQQGKQLNKDMRSRAARHLFGKDFYATRRGTATAMHNSGNYDILQIAQQLGHRDIKTTQIYIRPTMQQRADGFKGI